MARRWCATTIRRKPARNRRLPAELALVYGLLASDDGSYITGAMIPVAGGRRML
jgi:NAD(P)-dependent dehydrogenase (short-subunit alcohol dehydrogenase family)